MWNLRSPPFVPIVISFIQNCLYANIFWVTITHHPMAYLESRSRNFSSPPLRRLLGIGDGSLLIYNKSIPPNAFAVTDSNHYSSNINYVIERELDLKYPEAQRSLNFLVNATNFDSENSLEYKVQRFNGVVDSTRYDDALEDSLEYYDNTLKVRKSLNKMDIQYILANDRVARSDIRLVDPKSVSASESLLTSKTVYMPGDIMIGALFPIHYQPRDSSSRQCGDIWEQYGIQRLEAALRTLESVNADPLILPGISLGLEIRDSCWYSSTALGQTIEFIRDHISMHAPETSDDRHHKKGTGNKNASKGIKIRPKQTGVQIDGGLANEIVQAFGRASTAISPKSYLNPLVPGTLTTADDDTEYDDVIKDKGSNVTTSANFKTSRSIGTVSKVGGRGRKKQKLQHKKQSSTHYKNIAAIIGPGSSTVAIQVQNLLQLFDIPQIDYATSKDLSNKKMFKTYMRVVPSDQYQAQVMIDIVKHNGWTYLAAINTEGNYGGSGMVAFKLMAKSIDLCIAVEDSVFNNADQSDYDKIVTGILAVPRINVIVCFCEGFTVRGLLKSTKRLGVVGKYVFVGSDGWADRDDVIKDYETEAVGGISIKINSPYVYDFDDYYFSLRPELNTRNVWFRELWEFKFKCSLSSDSDPKNKCSGNLSLVQDYKQDTKLAFVINSVNTIAHGLNDMHKAECKGSFGRLCPAMKPMNGTLLMRYLLNVSFHGVGGQEVNFDENGDPPAKYDIVNFQRVSPDKFGYRQIGGWFEGQLILNKSLYQWPTNQSSNVISICSDPCGYGFIKSIKKGGLPCCWDCRECKPNEFVLDEFTCQTCQLGSWPDFNKTTCSKITERHVQWNDVASLVALCMASLGCILTCLVFTVFVRHNNTPVVKSSTRELMYVILIGILLSLTTTVPLSIKPDVVTCALNRTLPGLAFSMVYAALVTKTNRISRILEGTRKKERIRTKKPKFMSLRAQLAITFLLVSLEIIILIAMLVLEIPGTKLHYSQMTNESNKRVEIVCATSHLAIIAPLGYNFFLIGLCTAYAIKTRNLPENFNEAKFIGFGMYTTCVIWIAFVPVYFGSDSKAVSYCFCVIISAYVALIFLFLPKVYVIVFKPEKNNRSAFTTSKTLRYHFGAHPPQPPSISKSEEEHCGLYDGDRSKSPRVPVLLSVNNSGISESTTPPAIAKTSQISLAPQIFFKGIGHSKHKKGSVGQRQNSERKRSFVLKFGRTSTRRHTMLPSIACSSIDPKCTPPIKHKTGQRVDKKSVRKKVDFTARKRFALNPFNYVSKCLPNANLAKVKRPYVLQIPTQNVTRFHNNTRSPLYIPANLNLPLSSTENNHVFVDTDLYNLVRSIYMKGRANPWVDEEYKGSPTDETNTAFLDAYDVTNDIINACRIDREENSGKGILDHVCDAKKFDSHRYQKLVSIPSFERKSLLEDSYGSDTILEDNEEGQKFSTFLESILRFDSKHNKSCQTESEVENSTSYTSEKARKFEDVDGKKQRLSSVSIISDSLNSREFGPSKYNCKWVETYPMARHDDEANLTYDGHVVPITEVFNDPKIFGGTSKRMDERAVEIHKKEREKRVRKVVNILIENLPVSHTTRI